MFAGVLKSLVGLSASIYTSVYAATLKPDGLSFLLIIACAPLVAGLLAMPLFNAVPSGGADGDSCKQESAGAGLPLVLMVVAELGFGMHAHVNFLPVTAIIIRHVRKPAAFMLI